MRSFSFYSTNPITNNLRNVGESLDKKQPLEAFYFIQQAANEVQNSSYPADTKAISYSILISLTSEAMNLLVNTDLTRYNTTPVNTLREWCDTARVLVERLAIVEGVSAQKLESFTKAIESIQTYNPYYPTA